MMREKALCPRQLAAEFGGVKSEAEIRALTRKQAQPLPCVRSGSKRPIVRIYPSVFAEYLLFEQGSVRYGEVVEASRRSLVGARS